MTEPVEILECSGRIYALQNFRTLGGKAAAPPSSASEGAGSFRPGGETAAAPPSPLPTGADLSAARAIYDAKIAKQRETEAPAARIANTRVRLANLKNASTRGIAKLALEGKPFAQPGERDDLMLRLTGAITTIEAALSSDEILSILRPSFVAMNRQAQELGASLIEDKWALDKINRQIESARATQATKDAQDTGLHATLMRAAGAVKSAEDEEELVGPYTPDQIKKFANDQECSLADFTKRWIIQCGESFSIFCRGKYLSPIPRGMLEVSIPRDLSLVLETGPAKIERRKVNRDGTTSLKTPNDMLLDYATAARKTIVSLTLANSHYDPTAQTFYEAVCPVRRVRAKFNVSIDKWLRILGGAEAEKLLDWIATVTDLTRQTCALYFSGATGAGKGMFANGIARLWTASGAPTELGRVLENFNDGLLTCPLLFADEYVPPNKNNTAMLRQIIGSDSRALSRKFMPDAILEGCLRLILSGNNEHLLATTEELTNDDLEAVGKRFLHIKATGDAVAYLKGLNRLSFNEGWVTEDGIAAHAIWLRDNRSVEQGDRFLVEGHQTSFHQSMMMQGKVEGLVLEWLVKFLNAPEEKRNAANVAPGAHALVGNGEYLVNAQAIADSWDQFVKSDKTPATNRIGEVLRKFSKGEKRVHNVRFHRVNLDVVYGWADKHLVGIPEKMKELIDHPITDKEMAPIKRSLMHVV